MRYRPLCYFDTSIVHNQQESEDIAVDVFLKFLNKKTEFDNLTDIKSFLLPLRAVLASIILEGKPKMSVLNIIRAKLIERIFTVVKRGSPYEIRLAA